MNDLRKEDFPPEAIAGERTLDQQAKLEAEGGLRRTKMSSAISSLYRLKTYRRVAVSMALRLEGGVFFSFTLRRILLKHYGVYAGAYSYGAWSEPGRMPFGLVIGRYVSMAANVRVFCRNHPHERLSMHPFFYNSALGYVERDTIDSTSCWIGHDAWIGESAIITPGCRRIGIGSVVGAGAVVTREVPDFAIVGGNPAKIIRYRFDEAVRARLLESRWWQLNLEALLPHMESLNLPLTDLSLNHPLLSARRLDGNPANLGS